MCAYVRRQVNQLSDIPAAYHDLLYRNVELITVTTIRKCLSRWRLRVHLNQAGRAHRMGWHLWRVIDPSWDINERERQVRSTSYDLLGADDEATGSVFDTLGFISVQAKLLRVGYVKLAGFLTHKIKSINFPSCVEPQRR